LAAIIAKQDVIIVRKNLSDVTPPTSVSAVIAFNRFNSGIQHLAAAANWRERGIPLHASHSQSVSGYTDALSPTNHTTE
jgi:hypothetical protein